MLGNEDVDLAVDSGDEDEVCMVVEIFDERLADWSKYSIKKTLT